MTSNLFEKLKEELTPLLKRLPQYARLMMRLSKDPNISKTQKATLMAGIGYMASPIDLIPGVIPILGQLDDVLAVLMAIKHATKTVPEPILAEHLQACDLSNETITADIALTKRTIKELAGLAFDQSKTGMKKAWGLLSRKVKDFITDESMLVKKRMPNAEELDSSQKCEDHKKDF